jgi:hypothetical protein
MTIAIARTCGLLITIGRSDHAILVIVNNTVVGIVQARLFSTAMS